MLEGNDETWDKFECGDGSEQQVKQQGVVVNGRRKCPAMWREQKDLAPPGKRKSENVNLRIA
jgi:hypothetical protein